MDASPLIVLAKARRGHLLPTLCDQLVIPFGTAREVLQGADDDPSLRWLQSEGQRYVVDEKDIAATVAAWDLGAGETAVLSWAYLHPGFEAIVDDRAARLCARTLRIPVRGTLGILLLAKRHGLIESVRTAMNDVVAAGLHVDMALYDAVLGLAGEGR